MYMQQTHKSVFLNESRQTMHLNKCFFFYATVRYIATYIVVQSFPNIYMALLGAQYVSLYEL